MSLAIFIFGFGVGFWLWRYSDPMIADIQKFGEWKPVWLFETLAKCFILFMMTLPFVIGAGLVAICGYPLTEIFGPRE